MREGGDAVGKGGGDPPADAAAHAVAADPGRAGDALSEGVEVRESELLSLDFFYDLIEFCCIVNKVFKGLFGKNPKAGVALPWCLVRFEHDSC